eukprot:scaffold75469_cov18-Tisochrysis_lutea.AAC.1
MSSSFQTIGSLRGIVFHRFSRAQKENNNRWPGVQKLDREKRRPDAITCVLLSTPVRAEPG